MTVQFDEASRRWRVVDHDGTVHEEFETCAARGSGVTITVRLKPLGVPRRLRCARHFSDAEGQVWIMIVIVIVGVALLA